MKRNIILFLFTFILSIAYSNAQTDNKVQKPSCCDKNIETAKKTSYKKEAVFMKDCKKNASFKTSALDLKGSSDCCEKSEACCETKEACCDKSERKNATAECCIKKEACCETAEACCS